MLKKTARVVNTKNIGCIYIRAIFLLAILPVNNRGSRLNHTYIRQSRADYWMRMLMFTPWHLLFIKGNNGIWKRIGLTVVPEGVQLLALSRAFNLTDMVANCTCVGLGCLLNISKC